jgi:hypothetical protein
MCTLTKFLPSSIAGFFNAITVLKCGDFTFMNWILLMEQQSLHSAADFCNVLTSNFRLYAVTGAADIIYSMSGGGRYESVDQNNGVGNH